MPRRLMVPIRLDALVVGEEGTKVAAATADFSRLPFLDRIHGKEINRLTPNISESILSQVFRDDGLWLDPGVHLHWAMPDALTHGKSNLDFPALPNRWLITRETLATEGWKISRQWVVESDYLHPPEVKASDGAVCVPYLGVNWAKSGNSYSYRPGDFVYEKASLPEPLRSKGALLELFFENPSEDSLRLVAIEEGAMKQLSSAYQNLSLSADERWAFERFLRHPIDRSNQPFRYMGRRLPLSEWKEDRLANEYYPDLCAIGYGNPLFAAFYPDCRSVYGMRDELDGWPKGSLSTLRYKLLGWYADSEKDPVGKFTVALVEAGGGTELGKEIRETFNWNLFPQEVGGALEGMFCYAELSFDQLTLAEGGAKEAPQLAGAGSTITVANTPEEAFAACLTEKLSSGMSAEIQDRVEHQLEAMQYAHELKDHKMDILSRYEQIRHELGFNTVDGGSLWVIRKETHPSESAEKAEDNASSADQDGGAELPDDIAAVLDALNRAQKDYDTAHREIEGMRRQLFADWYKYMICLYPKESEVYDYPDPDLVRHFIEAKLLAPLEDKLAKTDEVEFPEGDILPKLAEHAPWRKPDLAGTRLADRLIEGVLALKTRIKEAEAEIENKAKLESVRYSLSDVVLSELVGKLSDTTMDRLRTLAPRLVRLKKADFIQALVEVVGPRTFEAHAELFLADGVETRHPVACFTIERIPGPRFWQPTNPVVLIEGDVATPTLRHGQDGTLGVDIFDCEAPPCTSTWFEAALAKLEALKLVQRPRPSQEGYSGETFGFNVWKSQPWNPLVLEWQVAFYPTADGANLTEDSGLYRPTYIVDNYTMQDPHPDLEMRRDKAWIADSGCVYSGMSILTPRAGDVVRAAIVEELVGRLKVFSDEEALEAKAEALGESEIQAIASSSFGNPVDTLLLAYKSLGALTCLSQTLNGFNDALLMRKQTLELAVQDPLGFESYRLFTDGRVHDSMGSSIKSAPTPAYAFTPIRAGCLKLLRLRLVDSFGRTHELKTDVVNTASALRAPASPYLLRFSPRLAQPSRLEFRWLDGDRGERESNSHPSTTPICGWLLTNRLDMSLMFYDASGKALGYFQDGGASWHEAVDSDRAVTIAEIGNERLRWIAQFVEDGMRKATTFLGVFIDAIEDALERIHPEQDSGGLPTALLIGRPVAVVRASLNLETWSAPAINQSWTCFCHDLNGQERKDDLFSRVEFPVRLGEAELLSDGLVGYWLEEKTGHLETYRRSEDLGSHGEFASSLGDAGQLFGAAPSLQFISPGNARIAELKKRSPLDGFEDGTYNFAQSIGGLPQNVTMLVDVEGSVRATIGILPCKEINIPPEQYSKAIKAIEMTFRHSPILTSESKVELPLRPLPSHSWSWVEPWRKGETLAWKEYFPGKRMTLQVFKDRCGDLKLGISGEDLWDYLLHEDIGWLASIKVDAGDIDGRTPVALVVDKRNRKSLTFDRILEGEVIRDIRGLEAEVEFVLETYSFGIVPATSDGIFTGKQILREGWLKLRQV